MAVPAGPARDVVALHRLEPREDVLEDAGLDVVGAGHAVGGRAGPRRRSSPGRRRSARGCARRPRRPPAGDHLVLEGDQVDLRRQRLVAGGRRCRASHVGSFESVGPEGRRRPGSPTAVPPSSTRWLGQRAHSAVPVLLGRLGRPAAPVLPWLGGDFTARLRTPGSHRPQVAVGLIAAASRPRRCLLEDSCSPGSDSRPARRPIHSPDSAGWGPRRGDWRCGSRLVYWPPLRATGSLPSAANAVRRDERGWPMAAVGRIGRALRRVAGDRAAGGSRTVARPPPAGARQERAGDEGRRPRRPRAAAKAAPARRRHRSKAAPAKAAGQEDRRQEAHRPRSQPRGRPAKKAPAKPAVQEGLLPRRRPC